MDTPTLLTENIHNLFSVLAGPDGFSEQPVELDNALTALTEAVKSAAPSYRGLALTLVIDKQPVSLTSAEPGNTSDIATSLRLSLAWIPSLGAGSRITFYASTPGTFVDLAADLAYALDSDIRLDEDIPSALVSDLTGVGRLSAVNKAVGVLVGHGHTLDSAQRELRHTADATRISIQKAAEAVTDNPSSALWDRHGSFGHHRHHGRGQACPPASQSVACVGLPEVLNSFGACTQGDGGDHVKPTAEPDLPSRRVLLKSTFVHRESCGCTQALEDGKTTLS